MRTNIEIDDELMQKALKYSKLKLRLLSFRGKVKWEGDLDKMRTYDKWEDH